MNFSRKTGGSNKQLQNSEGKNTRRNSGEENKILASALFSKRQGAKDSSNPRILKPPIPKPPNLKEHLRTTSSLQYKTFPKKQETAEEKKDRLKKQLNKFESPFKWGPRQGKPVNEPEIIIKRMKEKDKEVQDERKFKFRNLIFHVVITYELWRANKLSEAFEEVCGLESALLNQSNRGDFMFACIEDALWHVVTATKVFLLLARDMLTQAEELLGCIKPVGRMTRCAQAGIHGIKAAVFMEYGHTGNKHALLEATEAVELDRTNAEWHFFISKCMGRIRRVTQCHELVNPLEINTINQAINLDQRNVTYKVLLGQVLSERAFREYKKNYPARKSEQSVKIEKTNKAAMNTFIDAVEMSPNSPRILIRCARGLMRLPPYMKNLKFTKECIDKALELAPNNIMVHHVKGMYHERYDVDAELPFQAYEKAAALGNFGAAMDLVRLNHKLQSGDIIKELEILATMYEQEDKVQVIYAQAGSYLLFIKKDIIGAVKYYLKVIGMNPDSYAMMSHKSIFIRMRNPVNMFDVLLEELANKTAWKSFPPEDREVLKEFVIKTRKHEPLPNEQKKRPTVEEILNMSKETCRDDIYKETKGRKRRQNFKKKPTKRWYGKKKASNKDNRENGTITKDNEKLQPKGGTRNDERKSTYTNAGARRRDSISSVSTVDSDYHYDSTKSGPMKFDPETLYGTKCDRSDSNTNIQGISLDLTWERTVPKRCHSGRASRDSSISSLSSACSNADFGSNRGTYMANPCRNFSKSQLTVENLKKLDFANSYETGVRRLSKLSLSDASSDFEKSYDTGIRRLCKLDLSDVSPASSTDTLSVMDRVSQSFAMLGLDNKPTQGRKKHFRRYESTQSLSTQKDTEWIKDLGDKIGSSQSLNIHKENLDKKFSKYFKSGFGESSVGSRRSHSFMPAFACKNSESNIE